MRRFGAFVNWLPHFHEIQLCLSFYYWCAPSKIITGLTTRLIWNLLTDWEWRIVSGANAEQIIAEARRRFVQILTTCQKWLLHQKKSSFAWLLIGRYIFSLPPPQVKEMTLIKVSLNLFDLFLELGCVKTSESSAVPSGTDHWSLFLNTFFI